MNQETVNKANNLLASEKWCSDVITHIYKNNRMSLRFDTTQSCIESYDYKSCPDWLKEIILDAVEKHREEVRKEFESL